MKSPFLAALAATLLATAAHAAPPAPLPEQASIPFVNHGGIDNWRATDAETLYVQDRSRNWYKATLLGRCEDLPYANGIGFETRGPDTFDRFSTIVVRGHRCAVNSVVKSDPPPAKVHKRKG